MTAPRWLEIAWEQDGAGIAEIGGPQANASIVAYFREINRPDITSDEVPWCAAAYFWCLQRAGISIDHVPKQDRLLAVSAKKVGTRIAEPRVGCGVVMKRPGGHHVGFVTAWTARTIFILGGNQADSFCEKEFKRTSDMVFMWPEPPKTAAEVAAAGSRIADAAGDVRKDAAKVGGTQGLENMLPAPPKELPGVDAIAQHAGSFKTTVMGVQDFVLFVWGKAWWIAAALAIYWLVRMAWNAGWIRWWRAEDHNSGKAPVAAPAENNNEQWGDEHVEAA
jgi:uncharacterized protein (TIGR02594 family)